MTELLTEREHATIKATGDLWGMLCEVVGSAETRQADLTELVAHIHAIQQAILAQAAARAYPGAYRKLGETFRPRTRRRLPEPPSIYYGAWDSNSLEAWSVAVTGEDFGQ